MATELIMLRVVAFLKLYLVVKCGGEALLVIERADIRETVKGGKISKIEHS